jgi:hypothetical protein
MKSSSHFESILGNSIHCLLPTNERWGAASMSRREITRCTFHTWQVVALRQPRPDPRFPFQKRSIRQSIEPPHQDL